MIKCLETEPAQLSQFDDMTIIGNSLVVNSVGVEHVHYLLWVDGEDEAVLNMQGLLAEAYVPPIANSKIQ